ncbi:hypothetical protein E3T22_06855, partial [Cryobacterium sp. TMB3-10]
SARPATASNTNPASPPAKAPAAPSPGPPPPARPTPQRPPTPTPPPTTPPLTTPRPTTASHSASATRRSRHRRHRNHSCRPRPSGRPPRLDAAAKNLPRSNRPAQLRLFVTRPATGAPIGAKTSAQGC